MKSLNAKTDKWYLQIFKSTATMGNFLNKPSYINSSAKSQKGVNAVQQCSVENQKALSPDFVQQ